MPRQKNHPACAALPADVGRVLTRPQDIQPFARDWTSRYQSQPRCVVQPETPLQVARLLQWCDRHRVAVVPQGGNTGLVGGGVPAASRQAIVLSTVRLNRIRGIDAEGNTATVDAGVVLETLQQAAHERGRLFPLALAAQGSCTIGGNLATNAGGTGVLRYGNARDLCLGLEVVTAQGELHSGLGGLRKDNTGYDLRGLFIGSEGTLGVITGAVMKLFPLPASEVTALVAVDTPAQALALLARCQQGLGECLSAFELMSARCMQLVRARFNDAPKVFAEDPAYAVLLEYGGMDGEAAARARVEAVLAQALEQGAIRDAALAQSTAQARQFWSLRERIAEAQPQTVKHDISLPLRHIAAFAEQAGQAILHLCPEAQVIVVGHVGDGNLHYNVALPAAPAVQRAALEQRIRQCVYDRVHALQGSISAEHGIGRAKPHWLAQYKSAAGLDLMRRIKAALDPHGIMNPGCLLP